jgi:hypothetical protein
LSYPFFYYYVAVAVQANKEKRIAISIDGWTEEKKKRRNEIAAFHQSK